MNLICSWNFLQRKPFQLASNECCWHIYCQPHNILAESRFWKELLLEQMSTDCSLTKGCTVLIYTNVLLRSVKYWQNIIAASFLKNIFLSLQNKHQPPLHRVTSVSCIKHCFFAYLMFLSVIRTQDLSKWKWAKKRIRYHESSWKL